MDDHTLKTKKVEKCDICQVWTARPLWLHSSLFEYHFSSNCIEKEYEKYLIIFRKNILKYQISLKISWNICLNDFLSILIIQSFFLLNASHSRGEIAPVRREKKYWHKTIYLQLVISERSPSGSRAICFS